MKRGGDVRGAVVELARAESSLERQLARFADRARDARRADPYEAELAAGREALRSRTDLNGVSEEGL